MREPEPPPPVYIPPIVQHTGRGVCWSDVVAEMNKEQVEREQGLPEVEQLEAA